MELEHRVSVLEQEYKLLKNEVQATLLDIQEHLLSARFPDLRADPVARLTEQPAAVSPVSVPEIPAITPAPPAPLKTVQVKFAPSSPADTTPRPAAVRTVPASDEPLGPAPIPAPAGHQTPKRRRWVALRPHRTKASAASGLRTAPRTHTAPYIRTGVNGKTAHVPNDKAAPAPNGKTASAPNGRTAPAPNGKAAPAPNGTGAPALDDTTVPASAAAMHWETLRRQVDWTMQTIQTNGPVHTRELIESYTQRGHLTQSVGLVLLRVVAAFPAPTLAAESPVRAAGGRFAEGK